MSVNPGAVVSMAWIVSDHDRIIENENFPIPPPSAIGRFVTARP